MHLQTEDTDFDRDASTDDLDSADTQTRMRRPQTFRERHAMKILGVLMALSLGTVMFAQVAC